MLTGSVNFCFNKGDEEFIGINRYGAIWTNRKKSHIFSNTFRFIDDLYTCFNNNGFENNYNDIYPDELELKKKNIDCCKFSFSFFGPVNRSP